MEFVQVGDLPRYDSTFSSDNYQRYLKYEDRILDEVKKQVGICRKCNEEIPQTDSNTEGILIIVTKKHGIN
jgi:hypothetical protein